MFIFETGYGTFSIYIRSWLEEKLGQIGVSSNNAHLAAKEFTSGYYLT